MRADSRITAALLISGVLGLLLTGGQLLSAPAWCWLALVGAGAAHSIAWRAAGVRRVSSRERRRNAVRLRNAEQRERRHLKASLRIERKLKLVLAEVREHPDLAWGERVAATVRGLQEEVGRHQAVLTHHKLMADKTAHDLSSVLNRVSSEE